MILKIGKIEFGFNFGGFSGPLENVLEHDISIETEKRVNSERVTGHEGQPIRVRDRGELVYEGDMMMILGGTPGEENAKSLEALKKAWEANRENTKLETQIAKLHLHLADPSGKKICSTTIEATVESLDRINLERYKGFMTYKVTLKAAGRTPSVFS